MRSRKPLNEEDDSKGAFVSALARGLDILNAFRRGESSLGNKDFVMRTGLSKSTVSRLTYTLHKIGYLSYDPATSRYSLAPPVLSLGFSCLSGMSVLALSKPRMEEFANRYGAAVAIGGRDRLSMVYLECALGSSPVTLAIGLGQHLKFATSALGRAYIAAQPVQERERIFSTLEEHEGENWPDIKRKLIDAISCYETHGYCLSLRDWKPDVNAVAVPYIPGDGSPVLAFNCGAPAHTLPEEKITQEVGPKLVKLVAEISHITR